jgi:CRISPR-associated protein Csm5
MSPRIERVRLSLTPLSPIHLGCGTDFDPTSYVISDGLLYQFDPSNLPLSEADVKELVSAANLRGPAAFLRVQNFFHDRTKTCQGRATLAIPVSKGVASQYGDRIGQVAQYERDREFVNRLAIERTAHHPHTGVPYLPGSGIKGAMRTAWLDRLNNGRTSPTGKRWGDLEKELLNGGKFDTDPFRLISISDASGPQVISRVVFNTNHRKVPAVGRDGLPRSAQGLATRRECIAPGQVGALHCEIGVDSLGGRTDQKKMPAMDLRIKGWTDLAQTCNRYFLPRFQREAHWFATRNLVSDRWLKASSQLIADLQPSLDSGDAVLLRVGRHSGSENITLDGVRRIAIRRGKGQPPDQSPEGGTTVWLAAETEGDTSGMHPLGWVLLHRQDFDSIRRWSEHFELPDLSRVQEALHAAREEVRQEASRLAEEAERRKKRELENSRLEAERAKQLELERAKLAAMSENGRAVEALREKLNSYTAPRLQPISGELYQKTRALITSADGSEWIEEDRRRLGELLRTLVPTKIDLGGKAKEIKQAANRLLGLQ